MFKFLKFLLGSSDKEETVSVSSINEADNAISETHTELPVQKFKWNSKVINSMTKKELVQLAADNDIKISPSKKKSDIISDFKTALKKEGRL